jgi:hypothetical protein
VECHRKGRGLSRCRRGSSRRCCGLDDLVDLECAGLGWGGGLLSCWSPGR